MTTPGPNENRPAHPIPAAPGPSWPPPVRVGGSPPGGGRAPIREVGAGLAALGIAVAVGIPVGALWSVLAPRVEVVMTRNGPDLTDYQTEAFMGADGVFAVLGFAAGVVLAVCVWVWLRRRRGPAVLAGLTVGSLVGAWIAWRLGRQVGLEAYRQLLDGAEVGWRFYRPPGLRSVVLDLGAGHLQIGVLGAQALTVAIVYTLLAGWSRWPSLRRPDRLPEFYSTGMPLPSNATMAPVPAAPYQQWSTADRPATAAPAPPGPPPPPPPGNAGPVAPHGSGWPAPPGAPVRH